jgi:glutamyl-tRNA reductase
VQRVNEGLLALVAPRAGWPAALLGRIPATAEARARLLRSLGDQAPGRLALVTCERFEIYLCGRGVSVPEPLEAPFRVLSGDAAAERLLRVAAGLESRWKGERQILRQVRAAFLEAAEQAALDPVLHALARAALHAGKRVRIETELGRRATSVVTLALGRLEGEIGGIRGRAVLVVGTGALGVEVAKALHARGVGRLILASRDAGRAASLAARLHADGLSHADMAEELPSVDAIVACTNGPVALGARTGLRRSLAVVDLGAPPNIDAAAALAAGARVIGLADLGSTASDQDIAPAERIVALELERFRRWLSARALRARDPRTREAA